MLSRIPPTLFFSFSASRKGDEMISLNGRNYMAITAKELLDQLANDPNYQKKKADLDAAHKKAYQSFYLEQKRICNILCKAGLKVDSLSSLVQLDYNQLSKFTDLIRDEIRNAKHNRVKSGLIQVFGKKEARGYLDFVISELKTSSKDEIIEIPQERGYRSAVANTIVDMLSKDDVDVFFELIRDNTIGDERFILLDYIKVKHRRNRSVQNMFFNEASSELIRFAKDNFTWAGARRNSR
jgi:hypothetical protein